MNSLHTLLNHPLVESTGWALIHFLWQGAVIAGVLAVLLVMLRRAASDVKYIVCCLSLLLMAIGPLVTTAWLTPSDSPPGSVADAERQNPAPVAHLEHSVQTPAQARIETPEFAQADGDRRMAEESTEVSRSADNVMAAGASDSFVLFAWLETHLSWVLIGWAAGVVLLSARLLLCWLNVGRLSRSGTHEVSDQVAEWFADLSNRVGVSRGVRLLESSLVQVPTVLGALRPVILLPATAMTGLSASQLQAILAHELAHVRRHDYLVNLLQTAIETLLFYHPAVWWVSRRIRQERENCCDDVASSVCGNRLEYVQALVRMEEIRGTAPRLAVASTGGSLTQRVRRLIGAPVQPPHEGRRGWWLGGVIPVALLLFAASCISKVATDGTDGNGLGGAEDVYVVVWQVVVDQVLADRLLKDATEFDEQEGWKLQTGDAAGLRSQLLAAIESDQVIRLSEQMRWLAPLGIRMPPENLTGTFFNGDNVQFREPGDRAHILFTQNVSGFHRVLPDTDDVRVRLQTRHEVMLQAFNSPDGDETSEHRGKVEVDQRIPNGQAMLVTRALDPLLDWSPVMITVFEPVRIPSRQSQERQIHDLETWLVEGPEGIRRRGQAADKWMRDVAPQPFALEGKWSHVLENGSRVTLVGLSSPKKCPTAWWTPDGQPLHFGFQQAAIGQQSAELLALVHVIHSPEVAQAAEPIDLNAMVNPNSSLMSGGVVYLIGSDRTGMPDPATGQLVVVSVDAADLVELGVSSAAAARAEIGVVEEDQPLVLDEGEFQAGQVLKRQHFRGGDVSDVSMSFPWNREREVIVTAVTQKGDTFESQYRPRVFKGGAATRTGSVFDRFLLTPDEIAHFELQSVPLDWASFAGFARFPDALRELLTADVKQAAFGTDAALAIVGWTFQGNAAALADISAGSKPQRLGEKLSWFEADADRVRQRFLKLREDGDADPPGRVVGWMYDFEQYMHVLGAMVYRGPPTASFPFGYSTGNLPRTQAALAQSGMWNFEAGIKLASAELRGWQINGRWLVQHDDSTPVKGSQWSDVFDQKLKLDTELAPGRVAVIAGPTPGLKTNRTGLVVLECVPVPRDQIQGSRGHSTDIEQLLRVGPLRTLTLARTVSSPNIEVAPNPAAAGDAQRSATVRGRVLDHTGKPAAGVTVFPLGFAYPQGSGLILSEGKSIRRIDLDGHVDVDTQSVRALTDVDGRFELHTRNVTDLSLSAPQLDVWEVSAPRPGGEALITLPEPGRLVVRYDRTHSHKQCHVSVYGPLTTAEAKRDVQSRPSPRFRARTRKLFVLKRGEEKTINTLPPGQYWIVRLQAFQNGEFRETRGLDRTLVTVSAGESTEFQFARPAGTTARVRVSGIKEHGIAWSVFEVQPVAGDQDAPVDSRSLYSDVGVIAEGRFETDRLAPGRYRIRVRGFLPKDDDDRDRNRNFDRPHFKVDAVIEIPESGAGPEIEMAFKARAGAEPAAADRDE